MESFSICVNNYEVDKIFKEFHDGLFVVKVSAGQWPCDVRNLYEKDPTHFPSIYHNHRTDLFGLWLLRSTNFHGSLIIWLLSCCCCVFDQAGSISQQTWYSDSIPSITATYKLHTFYWSSYLVAELIYVSLLEFRSKNIEVCTKPHRSENKFLQMIVHYSEPSIG